MADAPQSDVERIKNASRRLRGTLAESLADPVTGALAEDDTQLSKFHGIYQQDDRDVRAERQRRRLEPDYSFMIRARVPGGVLSTAQWLNMDDIANRYANRSIRITTRQALQLHGVLKRNLKQSIADINSQMMDTLAACGDVNRNVMSPPLPMRSAVYQAVLADARELSRHLTPATRAYHEIWLDGEKLDVDQANLNQGDISSPGKSAVEAKLNQGDISSPREGEDEAQPPAGVLPRGAEDEAEPIYGNTYLPRKFKTAFAVPPQNDVDVYAQDLGFIAIVEAGELVGYNVTVGGGMGMSHGETGTYPRLADVMGFVEREDVLPVAEAVVTTQRDHGDRTDRKHARLKYTIDDRGLDWFRREVASRSGATIAEPRSFEFTGNGDVYGWQRDEQGNWHYTLFVENGRVADFDGLPLMSGLRALARAHRGHFRLTPNQNLIVSEVADGDKAAVVELLDRYGIANDSQATPLRLHSMACVAFPTCGLAMAESERYLPSLIDRIDEEMAALGLSEEPITVRMTGCPNGCARPYIAEIGLVGKGPGRYNLYLGAGFAGERLNSPYRENIDEREILAALRPLFGSYAEKRRSGERFGDFLVREAIVPEVRRGRDFHTATV